MSGEILIVAEHRDGALAGASLEAIAFGRRLAEDLGRRTAVLLLGDDVDAPTRELAKLEGIEILRASDPRFREYTPERYGDAVMQVARQRSPHAVVLGNSYQCIDLAPQLAGAMRRGLVSNCVGFRTDGDRAVFAKPVFGSRLVQELVPKGGPPYLVSVQPGAFRIPDPSGSGAARIVDVRIEPSDVEIGRRALGVVRDALDKIDLVNAEIVVAGGRGLGSKDNFKVVEDLARALGGAVGATRPVVDAGWLPREHQIGLSGQSIAPRLYVACAISGAPQHLVGLRAARCVVAINTDPGAPIFGVADYGIVGDVFRIVPALIASAQRSLRADSPR